MTVLSSLDLIHVKNFCAYFTVRNQWMLVIIAIAIVNTVLLHTDTRQKPSQNNKSVHPYSIPRGATLPKYM